MLRKLDFVQSLPADLIQSSSQGGALSIFAMVLFFVILVMEIGSYWNETVMEAVEVDTDFNSPLVISFDILMLELKCEHVEAVVNDVMGNRIEGVDDITWTELKVVNGQQKQLRAYTRQDWYWKNRMKSLGVNAGDPEPAPSSAELDADWASSHDGFQHRSFDEVIKFHDFHMINFFAGWCSHCQVFAPTWANIAKELDMKPIFDDMAGGKGAVKFIKINCVDFKEVCAAQKVRGFPEVRFYTRDGNYRSYKGARDLASIKAFVATQVKGLTSTEQMTNGQRSKKVDNSVLGKSDEEDHGTMCNLQGQITVPKVPGEFHVMATGALSGTNLNPLVANLSHKVVHMSVKKPVNKKEAPPNTGELLRIIARLTAKGGLSPVRAEALRNAVAPVLPTNVKLSNSFDNPFGSMKDTLSAAFGNQKGVAYVSEEVGTAPQHYLQIEAHELWSGQRVYDYSMYTRTASVRRLEQMDKETYGALREHHRVPQARFYYRIEPLVTTYTIITKRWYDVVTNIISLISATYLLTMGIHHSVGTIKKAVGMKAD